MFSVSQCIIINLALITFGVAYLLRPEWFVVLGADPISRLIRARRRARYGDRYK